MKKHLLILAFLPIVISCVPKLEKPPDLDLNVPQNWISEKTTGEGEISQWWTRFNDPKLNELVEVVLIENYDLKAAATRLDAAEALARIAGADLYPQVRGRCFGNDGGEVHSWGQLDDHLRVDAALVDLYDLAFKLIACAYFHMDRF